MLTLALRIWFVLPSAAGLETGSLPHVLSKPSFAPEGSDVLSDREIAERSPDSLVGSRRRGGIHRGPPGRSVLPNPKTHTRTRRKPALAIQKPAFPTS
jgi:hypothetical protein